MTLKLIKNEKEYDNALSRVDALMELNSKLGSKENDELEVLVMLVERYEEEKWAINEPDPVEAIKIRMEQMHLKQKDLVPYIGNASKVSEVLNRKISLSLTMITNLASALHIPLETLIPMAKKHVL